MTTHFTHGHALLVGVGADLPNTVDDAVGIADLLVDPGRCAYPKDQVTLLTAQQATRGHVLAALDQLVQKAGPDDTVIVYFSGHGYRVQTPYGAFYYLMTYGYDEKNLPTTAISGAEFVDRLRALRSRKLLLLLDCCHAGGLKDTKSVGGSELAKAPLPPEATGLLAAGQGRIAIASSRADQLSYAGKPYSAFTLALAEALCGDGASEQDGYARAADLAMHARQMVPIRTRQKQHPILNFDQADNFIVAYYAGGETKAKGLPFKVEEIQIEPEPGAFNAAAIDQRGQTVHGPQTNITGDVHGSVYSGNIGQIGNRTVNTGGGTYVERDVNTGGGDFVGGKKIDNRGGFYQSGWQVGTVNQGSGDVHHTSVGGDQINTGDISGTGIAIGRGAQAHVTQGMGAADLNTLFAPLLQAVQQTPAENRQQAVEKAQALQAEVARGEQADDERMADLIQDLVNLVPGAVTAVVGLFAPEALGRLAGGATRYIINRLSRK
jgi:hypothetical protein